MLFILWLLDIVLHTQIQNIDSVIKITFGFYKFCKPEISPVHHNETSNFQTLFSCFSIQWSGLIQCVSKIFTAVTNERSIVLSIGAAFLAELLCKTNLKGQCHEIFCFWFFSSISFPPAPECPIRTVSIFFENSRRYSQLKVDHRCRWHRWQMKKIFNQKNFNNFVGTPLDSRGNIFIHFCLQVHFKVSAAWY